MAMPLGRTQSGALEVPEGASVPAHPVRTLLTALILGVIVAGFWNAGVADGFGRDVVAAHAIGGAAGKGAVFAFHGLRAVRIPAVYFHDNPASGRVLEKLGFRPDGAANRDCLARGHTVYCLDMLLERENFGRRAAAR